MDHNSVIPCFQEKLRMSVSLYRPYPKPTQVGGENIPRRSREPGLRNSAKSHRNFGRRCALDGEGPRVRSCWGLQ